jgi:hypothetical protein
MAMAKRPTRARTERRIEERRQADLARDREKVARLEPGGGPERPIAVTSASVVEPSARATPCPLCGGALRVDEHAAAEGLRVVRATCVRCGVARKIYFRLAQIN